LLALCSAAAKFMRHYLRMDGEIAEQDFTCSLNEGETTIGW